MVAIVNVDPNVRESGPHIYSVRINATHLFYVVHNREEPLSKLFEICAKVAEESERTPF